MADSETTVGLEEAAAFLRADRTTVMALIPSGELPAAKIGRPWVILKSDLVDYLRKESAKQTSERRVSVCAQIQNRVGRPRKALPEIKG